jgi:dipeptidyl aminopeptidase/acylaminoacyl peptidase
VLKLLFPLLVLACVAPAAYCQTDIDYQVPPKEILELVDIKNNPSVVLTENGQYAFLLERSTFKTLDELAETELGLAGIRINPATNGRSRQTSFTSIELREFLTGKTIAISGLPSGLRLTNFSFSPDQKHAAFVHQGAMGFELWTISIPEGKARLIADNINPLMAGPYVWLPGSDGLLAQVIVTGRRGMNNTAPLPTGPTVQETSGSKAVVRTYQDLLKSPYDEAQFMYYMTGRWVKTMLNGHMATPFLNEYGSIYRSVQWSPNGKYLLVSEIQQPYSYIVPWHRFPYTVSVYDAQGKLVKQIHQNPLTENLPKGFDATQTGKRNITWRMDQPATLVWAEALDGGDPAVEAEFRDALYELPEPFSGQPRELMKTRLRFNNITWGNTNTAIVYDAWWKTRQSNVYLLDPATGTHRVLYSLSTEDLYADPGDFLTTRDASGHYLLQFSADGKKLYLTGEGYGPEGNRPFLDEMVIATGKTTRKWQADGKSTYESIVRVLDPAKATLITSIQSPTDYPNYYLRAGKAAPRQLTTYKSPYEKFSAVSKQTISYKRSDGVDLTGVLYLPPGYDKAKDGPLPVLMWAYPREFKSAADAGQVKESPHRFVFLNYGSPVYWAMRGYAVFDRADFPIVGEGEAEPNDSFIKQLVMNAEAAINTLADMGIADRKRIAIGGHSYGAFMTANLMAHSDLFAAGIARSGAYNRTLTPFGFQSEERTFWDVPDLYMGMSPFTHADKINEPLLMIHGAADDNPGTFTLQSERLYGAIKGLGGTARLVLLPYESHGYAARENILHMLWEMDTWLEKYVKNRQ